MKEAFDFGSRPDLDRFHVRGRGDVITFRLPHSAASELVGDDVSRTNGNAWICRPAREIIVNGSSFKIKEVNQFRQCFGGDSNFRTYGFFLGEDLVNTMSFELFPTNRGRLEEPDWVWVGDEQKSAVALKACEAECAELKELLHAAKVELWYRNEDRWSETTTALIQSIELKLDPKPVSHCPLCNTKLMMRGLCPNKDCTPI